MEIFRLDKAIENEKLDLEMAIAQLKEAKKHLVIPQNWLIAMIPILVYVDHC